MSTEDGARKREPRNREHSAGGVVVRGEETIVIVPTRRAADGRTVLALPKGHVDPGETPEVTAVREVREEAGVVGTLREKLGDVRWGAWACLIGCALMVGGGAFAAANRAGAT